MRNSRRVDETADGFVALGPDLRSVAVLGGIPHPCGAIVELLPSWLAPLTRLVGSACGLDANQALVNLYKPGQGIGHHKDGPLYAPLVAIISVGGSALLEFNNGDEGAVSVFLPPRSLVVFSGRFYESFTHGIAPRTSDLISATCLNSSLCGLKPGQEVARGDVERTSFTLRRVKLVAVSLDEFGAPDGETVQEIQRRKAWWLNSIAEKSQNLQ